jgi:hypothetical protein
MISNAILKFKRASEYERAQKEHSFHEFQFSCIVSLIEAQCGFLTAFPSFCFIFIEMPLTR